MPHPGSHPGTHPSSHPAGHPGGHPADSGHLPGLEPTRPRVDLDQRPMLVFWETTKACGLQCRHCRAEAQACAAPGELTHEEGLAFLDSLVNFGKPYPVLVLTGGDVLMRTRLLELVDHAVGLGIPVAVSPSVTPLLAAESLAVLREHGVKTGSISLDGASPEVHDGVRGVPGHFVQTLEGMRRMREAHMTMQINTVVMRDTVEELPKVARLLREADAGIWEVFFLVQTGRGSELAELSPEENRDVCHVLWEASHYGFVLRTVEGPWFRVVTKQREQDPPGTDVVAKYGLGPLYRRLSAGLRAELGEPTDRSKAQTKGTRDGRGIIFVAHDGTVTPAGFLPLELGNIKDTPLDVLYREHPLLLDIRATKFHGRCAGCEHATLCGGSRARAYARTGDALGEDPGCWLPGGGQAEPVAPAAA